MHPFVSNVLCYAHYISYGKFLLCKAVSSYWLYRAPVLCNKLPHLSNPTAFMKWEYSAFSKINVYFANEKVLWWKMESATSVTEFASDKSAAVQTSSLGLLHTCVKWLIFISAVKKNSKLYPFKHMILVFQHFSSMVSLCLPSLDILTF